VPIYPLYALLFAEVGLSGAQISLLLTIWSVVGVVAEVPSGMFADRFSRSWALSIGGLLQAAAYATWTLRPGFAGFAAGFVLWGIGGSFVSGASEALVYDGLAARGSAERFPVVLGRMRAAALVAQVPAAVAATILFWWGGYPLVGWASVGVCAVAAAVARRIPDTRLGSAARTRSEAVESEAVESESVESESEAGNLRRAFVEAWQRPLVRAALLAVAALAGLDALEEYVPLLAGQWSVPVAAIPLAVLGLPVAGALGAALGGRSARRLSGLRLGLRLGFAGLLLLAAALARVPMGLLCVFVGYGLYQSVLVSAGALLQKRITGPARATVTSLAALAGELAAFATYTAWALGGGPGLAVLVLVVSVTLPGWLRDPGKGSWDNDLSGAVPFTSDTHHGGSE
jgi:predicted MFS family arabinose efflux permease